MAGRRTKRKPRLPKDPVETTIESLSQDGRGVTHIEGKAIFVDGALAGEKVLFQYSGKNRNFDEGFVTEVLEASPLRIEPDCAHFGVCGGCSLQHLSAAEQIHFKQASMLENLQHIGQVKPQEVFPPITADSWGYRRKARLGVKYVHKKGKVLVGFREKRNSYLADLEKCIVLHPSIGERLQELGDMIGTLDARESIPQIEVAVGDKTTGMVFRHLNPLSDGDYFILKNYAETHDIQLYLQSKGPATVVLEHQASEPLYYSHSDFNVQVDFSPMDFIQVNQPINNAMVKRAVELLELTGEETVLDLFCGLGNFTLPIARHAKHVTGVEGDSLMIQRARETAKQNGIENTDYHVCNLMEDMKHEPWLKKTYDRILLDPPRSGAKEVIEHIDKLKAKRIVYVSCHPATLARDAGTLVNKHGYTLLGAGVMDMFPHTAHVESIAVFEKQ